MKPPAHQVSAQRRRVLEAARALARSGGYPDHRSIFAHLETLDGFADARDGLQIIRSQLDHLCGMAQSGRGQIGIPGRGRPDNNGCAQ